jgi:hypothetical protein
MAVVKEFRTAADYWSGMAEPDYHDSVDNPADLRAAFHSAISLFHMHDWVWKTHEAAVRAAFAFKDRTGAMVNVYDAPTFANALEQQCEDFGRVRGIANAAKHLQLSNVRQVPNAPSHAANTAVQTTGWGEGGFGRGPYGGGPRVMLAGPNGNDMEFSDVAKGVYEMWSKLRTAHGW